MSLDIYLQGPPKRVACYCPCCDHEHWREARNVYYTRNITHNLNEMAEEAGIYEALWRPEEIGVNKASQLISPLSEGWTKLVANPQHFKQFNPENGWGCYEGLVEFVADYLEACEQHPNAEVYACR